MSKPLPPIAFSPAVLGALQARGAGSAARTPAVSDPAREPPTKPTALRFDAALRRGQYLDIIV